MTTSSTAEVVTIEISDFAMPRDLGVGRLGNRVIFVPGAVPGDRVRAELLREGKGFTYGRMVGLESPSPWRSDAPCAHFGSCGGCSLLQFDYERQLDIKKRHLLETLKRIGGLEVEPGRIESVTPSVDQLFYRGKIELACNSQGGEDDLGLRKRLSPFEPYTGEVVPIESCSIFSAALGAILPFVRDYIRQFKISPFNERTKRGFLKGITVRESKTTGDLMVIVETSKGQLQGVDSLVTTLQTITGVKTICWLRDGHAQTLAGPGWITEVLEDLSFQIHPTVFFQPNPKTAYLLYQKVIDFARSIGARKTVGLYCGMGTLEIILSRHVELVEGYDSDPENIGNGRRNCKINAITNCRLNTKRIEDLNVNGQAGFDLALVDPSRTGMSKAALKSLLGIDLPAVAYISCDPATLARDLKTLVAGGYVIIQVMPFDFFPHTSHLETLVLLQKR